MQFDRRQALLAVAITLATVRARAGAERTVAELPECHQLTRSLIERARRASTATNRVDTDPIERIIRRMARSKAPPVDHGRKLVLGRDHDAGLALLDRLWLRT
jgi:hypothetical protein